MMQCAYEVRDSSIAGKGLFATEPIAKGSLLWKYSDESVRTFTSAEELRAHFATLSRDEIVEFLEHAYCWEGKVCEILDDGKYWNHSKSPNTGLLPEDENSSFALRDIAPGEELLDNYAEHDMINWYEAICVEYGVTSVLSIGQMYD